ncbi:MAG: type II toxin-antitoxin system death-on-curing family toxin [Chthoniobacteraceae bacterium]
MIQPYWFSREEVLALHGMMLAQFGGMSGVRDEHLLDSALAKPQHLLAYGSPGLARLAASYAAGVVKNHPFIDGNKRTGFMLGAGFLERNGCRFTASEDEATSRTLALAAGELSEGSAEWLEANSRRS